MFSQQKSYEDYPYLRKAKKNSQEQYEKTLTSFNVYYIVFEAIADLKTVFILWWFKNVLIKK